MNYYQRMEKKVDELTELVWRVLGELKTMASPAQIYAQSLAALQADVTSETAVEASVETLLTGISAALAKAIAGGGVSDPAPLNTLKAQLDANIASLSAAVAANTVAAPPAAAATAAAPAK